MGRWQKAVWMNEGAGRSRKERRSGAYHYYIPTKLSELPLSLDADVAGDVGRAEMAIQHLNESARALQSSEGIARLLLRAEAVSSSHIEGLTVGTRRLLREELRREGHVPVKFDETAAEVVGNIHAMEEAIAAAEAEEEVTVETILGIHHRLCRDTRIEQFGGVMRDRQNWVGGNSYNPLDAEFVPPAPDLVPALLEDLAQFCNNDLVSPVTQAALVHAQFETIHPFIDGNGRTGRALVQLILRRRGLAPRLVPPVSLVLATHAKSYVEGLSEFRFDEEDGAQNAHRRLNQWVSFFAGACSESCEAAQDYEQASRGLQQRWREELGSVRRNSALDLLVDELVGMPLFTIAMAAAATGRAVSAVTAAVDRCAVAGVVKPSGSQKRNRIFEVPEVINEFNLFERRLASPVGDTAVAPPARKVPERLKTTR